MWCERCAYADRVMLGTDEQPHTEWLILCEACIQEMDEDKAYANFTPEAVTASLPVSKSVRFRHAARRR